MVINYIYVFVLSVIHLVPFSRIEIIEEDIEKQACEILFNEIFISSSSGLKRYDYIDMKNREVIDEFLLELFSTGKNVFYEQYSYDISQPYIDSVDLVFMRSKEMLSNKEEIEINQLYNSYFQRNHEERDTVYICKIDGFIDISDRTNSIDEYLKLGYVFKLNRYIKSEQNLYVQAIFRSINRTFEIYLVFLKFFFGNFYAYILCYSYYYGLDVFTCCDILFSYGYCREDI